MMREEMVGGITPTITGDHQNRVTDYTAIVLELVVEDQGGRASHGTRTKNHQP